MKLSIPSDRLGTGGAPHNKGWMANESSDPNAGWEAFLQLWERAQLLRSFIWTQESADERIFFKQFLARARRFFSVDVCFVALFSEDGKILHLASPEGAASNLPANFIRHALDLIANSRVPVTWKQFGKDSGLKNVVVSPLASSVGQPLGFFLLGHMQAKHFSRSELFLLQLISGELSWAIRELRLRHTQRRQLANLSHELKNSLNVIMGDCALLREDLEPSLKPDERNELADIEATSQEILSLISTFLDGNPSSEGTGAPAEDDMELFSVLEDVLMSFRTKAKGAGFDLQINYADDLPREICTDPVRFRHVVRNLATCALESAGQHMRSIDIKKNGPMLELTVKGIDSNDSMNGERTFLDNATYDPKGAGFLAGLELIKEHVEFLKGHVHVVSGAGKKSDITVCLPCE